MREKASLEERHERKGFVGGETLEKKPRWNRDMREKALLE